MEVGVVVVVVVVASSSASAAIVEALALATSSAHSPQHPHRVLGARNTLARRALDEAAMHETRA